MWFDRLPWDQILAASKTHNLDPRLVAAIIQKESAGDTWAIRYEPGWRYDFNSGLMAQLQRTTQVTQLQLQKFSYGLMQVMGTVAYELGLRESPIKLCAYPTLGVHFGCMKLKDISKKYTSESDTISAYNAGSVVLDKDGVRRNQKSYVDGVEQFIEDLRKAGK